MLSISSKSRYGIMAVMSLAGNYKLGLLQIKDIAANNNIPHQYLIQIFNQLGKADIIKSVRGKNGGYSLSRPPSEVTVLDIIEVLEGEIQFVEEGESGLDAIQDILHAAESSLRESFRVSLADLASKQQEKSQILMFDI